MSAHAHGEGIHQADIILHFDLFARPQTDNLQKRSGCLSTWHVSGCVESEGQPEQNTIKEFLHVVGHN